MHRRLPIVLFHRIYYNLCRWIIFFFHFLLKSFTSVHILYCNRKTFPYIIIIIIKDTTLTLIYYFVFAVVVCFCAFLFSSETLHTFSYLICQTKMEFSLFSTFPLLSISHSLFVAFFHLNGWYMNVMVKSTKTWRYFIFYIVYIWISNQMCK